MSKKAATLAQTPQLPTPAPLKIMVASSVYNFQDQIRQICATLASYGYSVMNSHLGTIPNSPALSNLQNCVAAVDTCDLFFGIIRSFYGSGIIGERAITHEEVLRAVALRKPRWFVVDPFVPKARLLLRQYRYVGGKVKNTKFAFAKTMVMDDVRVIDMYEDAIQDGIPAAQRQGHWVQECGELSEILRYIEIQFKDVHRIRDICDCMKDVPKVKTATKAKKPSPATTTKSPKTTKVARKVDHG